jgi:glutamyl-tRNA reductase
MGNMVGGDRIARCSVRLGEVDPPREPLPVSVEPAARQRAFAAPRQPRSPSQKEDVMTTAIIGVGKIGSALARHLVGGGERLVLAARNESHAAALANDLDQ